MPNMASNIQHREQRYWIHWAFKTCISYFY